MAAVHEPHHGCRENVRWQQCIEPHHGSRENVRWLQCIEPHHCGRENVRWQQCMSLIIVVGRMLDGSSA